MLKQTLVNFYMDLLMFILRQNKILLVLYLPRMISYIIYKYLILFT